MPFLRVLVGIMLAAFGLVGIAPPVEAAGSCTAALTLTVQPGGAGAPGAEHLAVASDIPHGPFRVGLPLYPGATQLGHIIGRPVFDYPLNQYLQMAVAEYQTPTSEVTVMHWYRSAFTSCGWKASGSMTTNASVLDIGSDFTASNNPNLTVEMSYGLAPSGATYIAYAVEDVTYPPRPARSYLHGPFRRVRIALQHNSPEGAQKRYVSRITIADRTAISRLVTAVNAIRDYHTAPFTCFGGLMRTGPAWLTFVRPDSSAVHAFDEGPGACLGLAVNGARWLIDPGLVWKMITIDVHAAAGRG